MAADIGPALVSAVSHAVASSSVPLRLARLSAAAAQLKALSRHEGAQNREWCSRTLEALLLTVPRFADRPSRRAVCELLKVLHGTCPDVVEDTAADAFAREVEDACGPMEAAGDRPPRRPLADRFTLLSLVTVILEGHAARPPFSGKANSPGAASELFDRETDLERSGSFRALVSLQARLLDSIVRESYARAPKHAATKPDAAATGRQPKPKVQVVDSSLRLVRRCIRGNAPLLVPAYLRLLVPKLGSNARPLFPASSPVPCALGSVAVDVVLHLKPKDNKFSVQVKSRLSSDSEKASVIAQWYMSSVFSPGNEYIAHCMAPLLALVPNILPEISQSVARLLLRTPETTLGILPSIVESPAVEGTQILLSPDVFPALASAFKSKLDEVRQLAFSAFASLIDGIKTPASLGSVVDLFEEFVGRDKSVESRPVLYMAMVTISETLREKLSGCDATAATPWANVAVKALSLLQSMVKKETSDSATSMLVEAFSSMAAVLASLPPRVNLEMPATLWRTSASTEATSAKAACGREDPKSAEEALDHVAMVFYENLSASMKATGVSCKPLVRKAWVLGIGKFMLEDSVAMWTAQGLRVGIKRALERSDPCQVLDRLERSLSSAPSALPAVKPSPKVGRPGSAKKSDAMPNGEGSAESLALSRGSFEGEGPTVVLEVVGKLIELLVKVVAAGKDYASGAAAAGNSVGAALEGYVAICVLQQAALAVNGIAAVVRSQKLPQALSSVASARPPSSSSKSAGKMAPPALSASFLLSERIYAKISSPDEYHWFVLAVTRFAEDCWAHGRGDVSAFGVHLEPGSDAANAVAAAWIWAAGSRLRTSTRGGERPSWSELCRILARMVSCDSLDKWAWVNDICRSGLVAGMLQGEASSPHKTLGASEDLYRLLSSVTTLPSRVSASQEVVKAIMAKWASPLCHPFACHPCDRFSWITLCQRVHIDPGELAGSRSEQFLELVFSEEVGTRSPSRLFYAAGVKLASTLSFISPRVMVPKLLQAVMRDLDPRSLEGIGPTEIGMWKTKDGELYVDVLRRNVQRVDDRNRKGYETDKWEEELRKELAAKGKLKSGEAPTKKLTKEEHAAVAAQLEKEGRVRARLEGLSASLRRGLEVLRAVVTGNAAAVAEAGFVTRVTEAMLAGIVQTGGDLVGPLAAECFIDIGKCTSRLEEVREPLAVAMLRAAKARHVPERWCVERLEHLVTRLLYKIRFLSEYHPTSPATFGYMFPLLEQVVLENGLGRPPQSSPMEGAEKTSEQMILVTDIMGFHCDNGADVSMPRRRVMKCLLIVIKEHPQLSKNARNSLVRLCEAIGDTCTPEDVSCLFESLLSSSSLVRSSALQALEAVEFPDVEFSPELWAATFDEDERNRELARALWEENGMDVPGDYMSSLLELVSHDNYNVRLSLSKALAGAFQAHPATIGDALDEMYSLYKTKAVPPAPEYDEFGIVIPSSLEKRDAVEARAGIAMALKETAPFLEPAHLTALFEFLIYEQALGDRSEDVRYRMLDAGLSVIAHHGTKRMQVMMPIFEEYLGKPALPDEVHDRIREAVVILFGTLAGHLPEGDPRIQAAVEKLVLTLKTPSEAVQVAVSECLPSLVKLIKDDAPRLIDELLTQVFTSPSYAERRGAAYGIAGAVKGRGISALKECQLMHRLKESVENKKSYEARQGAIFCFETLSHSLGRLFEPYVIQILPLLLVCFGDPSKEVREATSDAARVIMSKISGHCVKLILPSLLAGLEDQKWRTKAGSVELLGSMAYCAPKQLSLSLPTVIPRLAEALNDSHQQVQKTARQALNCFGDVINNPEIQGLVPVLLDAICDPNKKTLKALSALLDTAFVHYIDAPSLALIVPILERGLRERSFEIKKKAAQIVGNMASLTDQKDLTPYLPTLLPGLKEVLTDPVPEARATAAKAFGTMVEKLGEQHFPNLVQELIQTLKSDLSSVDRAGAAQGLSEVLAGLGIERLDGLLPEILLNTNSNKSHIREGFLSLLIYLPATFGVRFQPYLGRIIPPILKGLADESEFVRDASLRAGQMIVQNYATRAVDLLLPELEKGLFDDNWRIRYSSIQLMGGLLHRITGVTASRAPEQGADEEEAGTEATRKALLDVLGEKRRNGVLAALYIVRSDVSAVVRQLSVQVWKSVVVNTPRTLKEILPVMMGTVIDSLASPSYDRRQVAARTLADMVKKLGEGILVDIIPILQDALDAADTNTRQGACIGLNEIMITATKLQIVEHEDTMIGAIRKGLCDCDADVREAAAQAFDSLHQHIGSKAIDEILPSLLSALHAEGESSNALEALKEVMAVRSNVVFPVLLPSLIATPITSFNARCLAALVEVAGGALTKRLTAILQALLDSFGQDEETVKDVRETIRVVLLSVDDEDGICTLMGMLTDAVKSPQPATRAGACDILSTFFAETRADYGRYVGDWLSELTVLLADPRPSVVEASWRALSELTGKLKKDEMETWVGPARKAIARATEDLADDEELPGFCLPKGIGPLLPIFLQGLMHGSAPSREQSALGICDLVLRTNMVAIKPFITQIAGPLIRVIGDRYPGEVKSAILQALGILLSKFATLLKPFLPQLQRTFVKSLSESSASVRSRASAALSVLITQPIRVDPLITELLAGVKASEGEVRENIMNTLDLVLRKTGSSMSEVTKKAIEKAVCEGFMDSDESVQRASAKCLGAFLQCADVKAVAPILSKIVFTPAADPAQQQASMVALLSILMEGPGVFVEMGKRDEVVEKVSEALASSELPKLAALSAGRLLVNPEYQSPGHVAELVERFSKILRDNNASPEVKRTVLVVLKQVCKHSPNLLVSHIPSLAPPILAIVRDRNVSVKLAGERCLLYLFRLREGNAVFQDFTNSMEPSVAKTYVDYHRRVLSKLIATETESDDEGLDVFADSAEHVVD